MAPFQNTVTIQRPVEDVFAFLADFENIPSWNYAILQTKKTSPGPVGVGTTYRQIRSIPRRSDEGFEVTVYEPTSRLEVYGDIGPFTATISYQLAPMGDGTRLINTVGLAPSPDGLRLLAPLAASRVKAAVAANLDILTQILETGQPTADSASLLRHLLSPSRAWECWTPTSLRSLHGSSSQALVMLPSHPARPTLPGRCASKAWMSASSASTVNPKRSRSRRCRRERGHLPRSRRS